MSNEKEIIKKLIKIANNQQKIINKLAQAQAPAAGDKLSQVKNSLKQKLIASGVPESNAQEYLTKQLNSFNLDSSGTYLSGVIYGTLRNMAGHDVLKLVQAVCKEMGIDCSGVRVQMSA
jgi:hypothetical protein